MNELIVIEKINPVVLFDGKSLDPLLEKISEQVKEFEPDTSTGKGRKEIAAMAHKIAKSKTFLDSAGKELVSGWKTKAKVVDAERKKMRDYLDDLKVETRRPLTEWENAEALRDEMIQARMAVIVELSEELVEGIYLTSEKLSANLEEVKAIIIDESFEDYAPQAAIYKDQSIAKLETLIKKRQKEEAEKAELEKLRKEAEFRKIQEQEEQLRREGEERARVQAEADARIEKERVERAAIEKAEAEQKERDRIEAEKQAAIDAQIEAERKAKQAEQDAINAKKAAEEEAERVRQETIEREAIAKERARVETENAAKVERDRIERAKQAEIEAAKKREADKSHKKQINNAAKDALIAVGIDCKNAKKAVIAIASGQVPHITIAY